MTYVLTIHYINGQTGSGVEYADRSDADRAAHGWLAVTAVERCEITPREETTR